MNLKKLSTKEILSNNLARNPNPVLATSKLCLHNIRSMHNIGSAFRTADGFGLGELILSGYTPVPPRPEISKTALGADESVSWTHINNPIPTLMQLKSEGFQIISLEQTSVSIPLPELSVKTDVTKLCFVFGNEITGIDKELLDISDKIIEIPQFGKKHSFNVSVSIGIALYSILEKTW